MSDRPAVRRDRAWTLPIILEGMESRGPERASFAIPLPSQTYMINRCGSLFSADLRLRARVNWRKAAERLSEPGPADRTPGEAGLRGRGPTWLRTNCRTCQGLRACHFAASSYISGPNDHCSDGTGSRRHSPRGGPRLPADALVVGKSGVGRSRGSGTVEAADLAGASTRGFRPRPGLDGGDE